MSNLVPSTTPDPNPTKLGPTSCTLTTQRQIPARFQGARLALSALSVIVITGRLLHGSMLRLLHSLRQGDSALRRLRQIARISTRGRKTRSAPALQRTAPLYDQVDRLRRQRPLLHRLPAVDGPEDRPLG